MASEEGHRVRTEVAVRYGHDFGLTHEATVAAMRDLDRLCALIKRDVVARGIEAERNH